MLKVGIIDYNCGNLASLKASLKRLKVACTISSDPLELDSCERLILPGVGAFPFAMRQLQKSGLANFIRQSVQNGKPFLGICMGMQILFDYGREFEKIEGLGILKGIVEPLPDNFPYNPNMGWWQINGDYNSFATNLTASDTFYFAHSYYCIPEETVDELYLDYSSQKICCAVRKENVTGVQFHPEKSQKSGEKIFRTFLNLP